VLDALVRKTERIRDQLGSAGQVIEERIAKRLAEGGIVEAKNLAREIEEKTTPSGSLVPSPRWTTERA
jgi:hypothetical protein